MSSLTKWGGASALWIAASYIFGFALFLGVIDRSGYEGTAGNLAFVVDQSALVSTGIIVLYPLAACALTILTIAIRRQAPVGGWGDVAALFGGIWAALLFASGFIGLVGIQAMGKLAQTEPAVAQGAWVSLSVVQDALGGGIELVGGVWMALVSALAMRSGFMGRFLGWFGVIVGVIGALTLVPALSDLVDVFGLGQIVWFASVGILLLQDTERPLAEYRQRADVGTRI